MSNTNYNAYTNQDAEIDSIFKKRDEERKKRDEEELEKKLQAQADQRFKTIEIAVEKTIQKELNPQTNQPNLTKAKPINSKKSIGNQKKTSHNNKKELDRLTKTAIKTALVTTCLIATAIMIAVPIHTNNILNSNNSTAIISQKDQKEQVENYIKTLKLQKLDELISCDLIEINIKDVFLNDEEFNLKLKNNTTDDYKRLNITSSIDLYIYKELLPKEEFNKLKEVHNYIEEKSDKEVKNDIFENAPIIIASYQASTKEYITTLNEGTTTFLSNRSKVEFLDEILQKQKLYDLLNYGLAEIATDKKDASFSEYSIKIKNNSIEDYKKLGISEKIDIYTYWKLLPHEEFYKFIQATTYKDSVVRYHTSFEQALKRWGYINTSTNTADSRIFENYMEAELIENADNYIEQLKENGRITSIVASSLKTH